MIELRKIADENDDENAYWVCILMIDKRYQGKGYGKEAMVKTLELIKIFSYGKASVVFLSYELGNVVAKKLYATIGFVEKGEIEDGEMVAKLTL